MKPKKKKFNWLTRLNRLARVKAPEFKPRDFTSLLKRAGKWPTCACGQLCKSLPRNSDSGPIDWLLHSYGLSFHIAVRALTWKRALQIFHQIERRSEKLLNDKTA